MKKISVVSLALLFVFHVAAYADTVYLKNGGKVRGSVIYESREKIKIKTAIAVVTVERSSIDKIETDKPTLEEELKALRASIPKRINQVKASLQKEIDSLKEESEDSLARQSTLDRKITSSQNEIASLKDALAETESRLFDAEKELREKAFLLEKSSPAIEERDSLIEKITKERDSIAEELASIRNEDALLQEQLSSVKEELKVFRASIPKRIDQAKASLQKEIDSLKEESEDSLARQSGLDRKITSSQNEIASLKDALAEAESHLFSAEKELKEKAPLLEKPSPATKSTQRKKPDFKNLLDLKLPEQTAELADKINSFYYNFIDKNVNAIRVTISDSQMQDIIEKTENKYIIWDIDVAKKMKEIKIVATYNPFRDLLTFSVFNKPEFKTEELKHIIEEIFIDSSIRIYKELLAEQMACLIPLINPKYDKVQSMDIVDGNLVIELLNQVEASYWTFDKEYRLKSIEKLDAEGKTSIKQIYEFEIYESKYLIKSFAEKTLDCYSKREIEYQLVQGIKMPNRFLASSIDGDLNRTNLELYFSNIEVILN